MSFRNIAFLVLALAVTAVSAADNHLRFVVTGDDRWNTKSPRLGDLNGVNVGALKKLVPAIIADKPAVLLFNGDLVGGAKTDEAQLSQFDTWKKAIGPIYDAGIKVLAARGNHETHCPHHDDVWRQAMSGKFANPQDGPAGEEGETYAYPMGDCLFIALDQFKSQSLAINQDWLSGVLGKPHPKHVFAFSHKMAFFSGNHDDGMFTVPGARDAMMNSFKAGGLKMMFFGHDHLYDHSKFRLPEWAESDAIHQVVVGTAGAPFVHGKELGPDANWIIERIKHVEDQLGYVVVDVDGDKVTVNYKSETSEGNFEVVETFSYSLSASK